MKHLAFALVLALLLCGCESAPAPEKDPAKKPATTDVGGVSPPVKPKAKGPFPESTHPALKDPSKANEKAPATFQAKFETTAGDFVIEVTRDWAPHGADRFYNLVKIGFFNDVCFFRAIPNFMAQFGIHGNPEVSKHWKNATIEADEVKQSNERGMLTYAMAGHPTTRSTQLFINFKHNKNLDKQGFAPIGKVISGMENVAKIHTGYADKPSAGGGQGLIQAKGNKHLRAGFPKLDYIKKVTIVGDEGDAEKGDAK